MTKWPHLEVVAHDPYFLDHSLLTVTIEPYQAVHAKPFKFLNHLVGHKEFHSVVASVWDTPVQGYPMMRVWKKLKLMKEGMKSLNNREFSNTYKKINSTRQKLMEVQEQLRYIYNDPELHM